MEGPSSTALFAAGGFPIRARIRVVMFGSREVRILKSAAPPSLRTPSTRAEQPEKAREARKISKMLLVFTEYIYL
jgi:hypothetical protein